MTLRVPWGQMWDDFDFQIKVAIKNGEVVNCKYFEWTEGFDNSGQPNQFRTND
jgi:hypothetical protein